MAFCHGQLLRHPSRRMGGRWLRVHEELLGGETIGFQEVLVRDLFPGKIDPLKHGQRCFWSEIFSLFQQVQQHQEHRPFLGRSLQDVIALYYDAKEQHTLSDDVVAALKATLR